jgi:hypothetical protein
MTPCSSATRRSCDQPGTLWTLPISYVGPSTPSGGAYEQATLSIPRYPSLHEKSSKIIHPKASNVSSQMDGTQRVINLCFECNIDNSMGFGLPLASPPPFASIRKGLSLTGVHSGAPRHSGRFSEGMLLRRSRPSTILWLSDITSNDGTVLCSTFAGAPEGNMATTKTATLTLRIDPDLKEALRTTAEMEHRSIANMVEVLIRDRCERQGIPISRIREAKYSREQSS